MSERPQVRRLHFQWKARNREQSVSSRCWSRPFWYGDGTPATEPSIVMRESDYRALLKRASLQQSPALCDGINHKWKCSVCGIGPAIPPTEAST